MNLGYDNSPNSNPRFPGPPAEVGVPQYQVPETDYILLVEKIDPRKGDFVPLDPRDNPRYKNPDAVKYPPLYLVRQTFTADGKWCYRYWSSDRNYKEQDTWNYSLKYAGENVSFPIYARNYIVARKDYKPFARKSRLNALLGIRIKNPGVYTLPTPPSVTITGTDATVKVEMAKGPDIVFPPSESWYVSNIYLTSLGTTYTPPVGITFDPDIGTKVLAEAEFIYQPTDAVLIKEQMDELPQDHPLHGRYVRVSAFYSTIPGPWFYFSKKEPDGSFIEIKRRQNWTDQIVPKEEYDSTTRTYSSVNYEPAEDTDYISWEIHTNAKVADPSGSGNGGTDPFPEYNDGWLIRQFPDRDGVLITEKRRLNVVQNITPGLKHVDDPDDNTIKIWTETKIEPYTGNQLLVWEVINFRTLPGNTLYGQRWDKESGLPVPYTLQYRPDHLTTEAGATVEPMDQKKYLHRVEQIPEDIDDYLIQLPSATNLPLPKVLKGIKIEWTEDSADGYFNGEWNGEAVGVKGSLSGNENGNASSSGALIPTPVPDIDDVWSSGIPTTLNFFFMKLEDISEVNILSKLNATRWPVFKPKSITLNLKGGKVAVQARAAASAHRSFDTVSGDTSWDKNEGQGESYDVSPLDKSVTIGPTLHDEIELEGDLTKSIEVVAEAEASWTGSGTYPFPSVNVLSEASKTLNGSVTPTIIPATDPVDIPRNGIYLLRTNFSQSQFDGYMRVMAETIDASIFA